MQQLRARMQEICGKAVAGDVVGNGSDVVRPAGVR